MKMVKLSMVVGQEEAEDDTSRDVTAPVVIDASQVRNFYPRKHERPGTRILFRNGSALAVTETFDAVEAAIRQAVA